MIMNLVKILELYLCDPTRSIPPEPEPDISVCKVCGKQAYEMYYCNAKIEEEHK